MKKLLSVLLAAVMLLSLAACKSDAVKAVEAMIAGFTEMTPETEEDAAAIQEAYNALSAEERKKVKGYPEFTEMRDTYYESLLSGVWYAFDLNLHEPESVFSPRCSITLNGDMTAVHEGVHSGTENGTWEVKDGCVVLSGIQNVDTEHSSHYFHEGGTSLSIEPENGTQQLMLETFWIFLREADYMERAEDVVRVVDLSVEDPADYIGFTTHRCYSYDEWGMEMNSTLRVTPTNLLYDEGWMFVGTDGDFALEVLYPEFNITHYYNDGDISDDLQEAGAETYDRNLFLYQASGIIVGYFFENSTAEADLSPDQLSFGRAKGKIYYVNRDYIADVRRNDGTGNRELIPGDGYAFLPNNPIITGWWEENNNEF